jgi:glycyl-tRNA synthetase
MEYDEPKKVQKTVVKPNLSKFGPIFKGDSPKVKQAIEDANPEDIKAALEKDGKFTVELDKVYEVDEELLIFEDVEEEITGEQIIPHVIEPSFGIDRIVYSVLLHSFCESDDKDYFKFNKSVAPVQVGVFPLVNKEGPREIAQNLTEELRMNGFRVEYDATGTIGKRYARADEIGIPLAITVDFDTLEDNQVTVRDRDTEAQERIAIDKLNEYLEKYYK